MSKARSPRYPAVGLKEALARVAEVYQRDYQNKIPKDVVVRHMGFGGLNGKSLGVLSAASKFGLLEGRADAMWVSDDALAIIAHPAGAPERVEAIKSAASRPELFAELDKRFQGGKASDEAIRSYLLTQKFLPSAVDSVVRSYRETKSLVDAESAGYGSREPDPQGTPAMHAIAQPRQQATPPTLHGHSDAGERSLGRYDFEGGAFIKLVIGGDIATEEALDMAETLINLKRKEIERRSPPRPAGDDRLDKLLE